MLNGFFTYGAGIVPLLAAVSFGQSLKLGEAPPPLTLEHVMPAGAASTWETLRGKPVVLEFWATWCGPCLYEIPHLNELASRFKDVQFVSITDEPIPVIERFLAGRPVRGTIGLDYDRSTFKAYGIQGIPQTLLVDKDGVLRGILLPRQVTDAVLADLIAGRPLSVQRLAIRSVIFDGAVRDPLFATVVRPAEPGRVGGVFRIEPGFLEGENLDLRTIVAHAYSVYMSRVEGPEAVLATRYDFCVVLPQSGEGEQRVLQDMLGHTFQLKVSRDTREVDALVLKAVKPKLQNAPRGGHSMRDLARTLEWRLKRFVVDETGLSGTYDFAYPPRYEALEAFVRDQLGLELSAAKRPVEILVVHSAEVPSFRLGVSNTLPAR